MSISGIMNYFIQDGILSVQSCNLICRQNPHQIASFAKSIIALDILDSYQLAKYISTRTKIQPYLLTTWDAEPHVIETFSLALIETLEVRAFRREWIV